MSTNCCTIVRMWCIVDSALVSDKGPMISYGRGTVVGRHMSLSLRPSAGLEDHKRVIDQKLTYLVYE